MENNNVNNNANTNANTQKQPDVNNTNTQPGANGNNNERLFTQDEVNKIVSDRLEKEKNKAMPKEEDERETELKKRENALLCREYLAEKQYLSELAEILDTSNAEKFKKAVEELAKIVPGISKIAVRTVKLPGGKQLTGNSSDSIADAFKLKK